jgi:hypothetical protein
MATTSQPSLTTGELCWQQSASPPAHLLPDGLCVGSPRVPSVHSPLWFTSDTHTHAPPHHTHNSHLAYHQYKGLLVPITSGPKDQWPKAPEDLPMGMNMGN